MAEIERMAALCMKDLDEEEMDDEDVDDEDLLVIPVKHILVRTLHIKPSASFHVTVKSFFSCSHFPAQTRHLLLLVGSSSIFFSMHLCCDIKY